MQVSLKGFEELIKAAEPKHLSDKGAPGRPEDIGQLLKIVKSCPVREGLSDVSLDHLHACQAIIWQVGTKESPWQAAKQRYADALRYLVKQMFLGDGPLGEGAISPGDALLLGEYKKNWMEMLLRQDTSFWHRSSVKPEELQASRGLSKRFATEVCIPDGGLVGDWRYGNKFIFAVKAAIGDEGEPTINKGGKLKSFGFGRYEFLILQPGGTRYMSDIPVSTLSSDGSTRQVAFPDDIPLNRITVYELGKKLDPQPW